MGESDTLRLMTAESLETQDASRQASARLSDATQKVIRQTVAEIFGPDARVLLFGSRTDPQARGGDIDLLVVSDKPVADRERKALTLVARLQIRLGDQPIDALVLDPQTRRQPIHEEAFRTGVPL